MWRKRKLPAVAIVAVLSLAGAAWFARAYLSHAQSDNDDAFALSIVGGWWSISGERHLMLDWEGRRASLRDYGRSDADVESVGSWRTTQSTVLVHVAGGELTQELELVGTDAEMFLAPAPAAQARLLDSWIADHAEGDEDMSPSDRSSAREARRRLDACEGRAALSAGIAASRLGIG